MIKVRITTQCDSCSYIDSLIPTIKVDFYGPWFFDNCDQCMETQVATIIKMELASAYDNEGDE